jgi:flagellar basal body-associated protein FliL
MSSLAAIIIMVIVAVLIVFCAGVAALFLISCSWSDLDRRIAAAEQENSNGS